MRPFHILMLTVTVVLAIVVLPSADTEGDSDEPQDRYPYADFIVTRNTEPGSLLITKERNDDGTLKLDEDGNQVWSQRQVTRYSPIVFGSYTTLPVNTVIVMEGGDVDRMTLIELDVADVQLNRTVITFEMYGGTITNLAAVSVADGINVPTSPQNSYSALRGLNIDLYGGRVINLSPTSDNVFIRNMNITIDGNPTVDRFYPTGTFGKYDTVSLTVIGGHIGYMSHRSSVVGEISYDLVKGSADYLCLGADTESQTLQVLSALATFYVSGNVDVSVGPAYTAAHFIIGSGLIGPPSILYNGEKPSIDLTRKITIDAPYTQLSSDNCFLNERRTSAYRFNGYRTDGFLTAPIVVSSYCEYGGGRHPTYGTDGVWYGYTSHRLPTGNTLVLNTELTLWNEGDLLLNEGSKLINTGKILVYGSVESFGSLVNNGTVEKRDSGSISGNVGGTGYTGARVTAYASDQSVTINRDDDTLFIGMGGTSGITQVTAMMMRETLRVVVDSPSEIVLEGDTLIISLVQTLQPEEFRSGYSFRISGLTEESLARCNISITVPFWAVSGYENQVFLDEGDEMVRMDVTAQTDSSITFKASGTGTYYLKMNSNAPEEKPQQQSEIIRTIIEKPDLRMMNVLIVVIIILSALVIVLLLRKRS